MATLYPVTSLERFFVTSFPIQIQCAKTELCTTNDSCSLWSVVSGECRSLDVHSLQIPCSYRANLETPLHVLIDLGIRECLLHQGDLFRGAFQEKALTC